MLSCAQLEKQFFSDTVTNGKKGAVTGAVRGVCCHHGTVLYSVVSNCSAWRVLQAAEPGALYGDVP